MRSVAGQSTVRSRSAPLARQSGPLQSKVTGGSPYLAAFIAGLTVDNKNLLRIKQDHVQERVLDTYVAQTVDIVVLAIFVVFDINLDAQELIDNLWAGLAVMAVFILIARPITVGVCLGLDRRSGRIRQDKTTEKTKKNWVKMLDSYAQLQFMVDVEINACLRALENSGHADNTIVVFVSDHGDYVGSHGLRGKGYGAYDEGLHIPLIVKDPSGTWVKNTKTDRHQMFSSVDLAALFLTIATGNEDWRKDARYAQIAGRASIASALANPRAAGRRYIAHATDEEAILPEQISGTSDVVPYDAPNHVSMVRTKFGKIARYAYWKEGGYQFDISKDIQWECYDYRSKAGRLELDNVYYAPDHRDFVKAMKKVLDVAMREEIRAPLPSNLQATQKAAFQRWFGDSTASPAILPTKPSNFTLSNT